ncbi:MAG: ABC transporter permease [Streptosporangiaceae bacterium]
MTAIPVTPVPATRRLPGHYGFAGVARMEWIKLRSVRSTGWLLGLAAAAVIGLAILVLAVDTSHWSHLSAASRSSFDPANNSLTGLALGQLLMATLGALVITSEFSSGLIRSTFAAAPNRPLVLAAKAAVLGAVTLAAGEVLAFAGFLAGQAAVASPAPHATLGQPGVLRAVLMGGGYLCLIALTGLGLGAIIRHTAGAIAAVVGVIFVLPLLTVPLPASLEPTVQKFLPEPIAANSLTAVKPIAHTLSPWAGLGLLILYTAVLLGAGAVALAKRDA